MTDTNIFPTTIPTPTLAPENEGAIQYLLVALAGHEYGVLMGNLQEVLRYNPAAVAPVPNTPQWLEGVFSLRGTIISVVNLRIFLGLPRAEDGAGQPRLMPGQGELFGIGGAVPRLVVLHDEELIVGVVVDDIKGVLFVHPDEIKPTARTGDIAQHYLEGIYKDPKTNKTNLLLDVRKLIASPEMLVFEPGI